MEPGSEPCGEREPGATVAGEATALYLGDVAERGAGKNRAVRADGRKRSNAAPRLVDVAGQPQVPPARAQVPCRGRHFSAELALHVDVPRLQRRVAEPGVDGRRRQASGPGQVDRLRERNRSRGGDGHAERRVARGVAHRRRRRLVDSAGVGGANDRAAIGGCGPGQAEARFDVAVVLPVDPVDVGADAPQ
ncbi:hypothetical protein D3C83_08940 [compost metagenome]